MRDEVAESIVRARIAAMADWALEHVPVRALVEATAAPDDVELVRRIALLCLEALDAGAQEPVTPNAAVPIVEDGREKDMGPHEFVVVATGLDIEGPLALDAAYEAGCSDALVSLIGGRLLFSFSREADTFQQAVGSAWLDVIRAGATVLGFESDLDHPLTDADLLVLAQANAALRSWDGSIPDNRTAGIPAFDAAPPPGGSAGADQADPTGGDQPSENDRADASAAGANADARDAARARRPAFRAELAGRAGGLLSTAETATLLSVDAADVEDMHARGGILGVRDDDAVRFPAAQIANGAVVAGLAPVLAALADMDRWGVLQLLTAPLDGFGDKPATVLELLAGGVDVGTLEEIVGLAQGWAE